MKVHKKFMFFVMFFLTAFTLLTPYTTQASTEYDYGQRICGQNQGVDVVFVMNTSHEMSKNDPIHTRVDESINFVKTLQLDDRVSIIGFTDEAQNLLSLTTNRFEAENVFNNLPQAGGNDLSTGMNEAIKELGKNSKAREKVMIVMTTGNSINNAMSLELAQKAYEQNITIYIFGFGASTDVDKLMLEAIAKKSGGSYHHAPNAISLAKELANLNKKVTNFTGREVSSDWKLTKDVHETSGLLLHENVKLDLNGYDLTVDGDLVLLSCAELRAVSGVVTAGNLEQKAGSSITLNNSQLNVEKMFTQNGLLLVNGDFEEVSVPEIIVNDYRQLVRGLLDLKGRSLMVNGDFVQEGRAQVAGGNIQVNKNLTQKGFFNLQGGKLVIKGNLVIDGGPLAEETFTQNTSLNVGGGVVQIGSAESIALTRETGNVLQQSGQLFVNHGAVRIFGDYTVKDGWLTMTKGSMNTSVADYGEGDGDYVHVHGDFSMESPRNHGGRSYQHLGKPMDDQAHLTDGVLQVDGNFRQIGDKQYHAAYSDRSQNYLEDYSRLNFAASGRHKVLLTGRGTIDVQASGFQFNLMELRGSLGDYQLRGPVKWKTLIERDSSANANLSSLTINDIAVYGFNANVFNYFNHRVPASGISGPLQTLKVDARAEDHRNAKVEVVGNVVGMDGTAKVQVLVTAHDGKTTSLYTVYVTVGNESGGKVTSLELDREEQLFIRNNGPSFSPEIVTIGYTIKPNNADNQQVIWTSTDESVAKVNASGVVTPIGIGEATIVAKTADGNFTKAVTVKVKLPYDLLEGVQTLADFVSDNDRYNNIMSLYNPSQIGIVVPGKYLKSMEFTASGQLVSGEITTDPAVSRVEVRVNNRQLSAPSSGTNKYLFNRAGLSNGDYIEVFAYNAAGDELERIATSYPVDFVPIAIVPYGFYSIQDLLSDPGMFNLILNYYAPEQLRFTTN